MESGFFLPWSRPPPCPTRAFSKSSPSSFPSNLTTLPPCRKILQSQLPGFCKTLLSHRIDGVSDSKRRFLHPSGSLEEDENERKEKEKLGSWDSLTGKFAAAANVPFLLLQMPQIVLNCRNLLAGNKGALFAIPWIGMLTGLLGNLSLLSYFAKKRETEAVIVQTLGVISTYVVIVQLALADAMPSLHFIATSTVVMWSTFIPHIAHSILPGTFAFLVSVITIVMDRTGKLSKSGTSFVSSVSGWTATLLFMWMPVVQMWTNYLNPDNIRGLSAFSMVLTMIGNAFLFQGHSSYVISCGLVAQLGHVSCMGGVTCYVCIGIAFWRDSKVYGYSSPLFSLNDLVAGWCSQDRKISS